MRADVLGRLQAIVFALFFVKNKKIIERRAQHAVITIVCRTIVGKLRTACCPRLFHMSGE